jgi:ferredoxin
MWHHSARTDFQHRQDRSAGRRGRHGRRPGTLHAEEVPVPSAAVGLLYDASICIGCKACESACAEANDTPPDTSGDGCIRRPTT